MDIQQASFFDPIVPYIRTLRKPKYIEIELPPTVQLDLPTMTNYFEAGTLIETEHTGRPAFIAKALWISGNLKDQAVYNYLAGKWTTFPVNFVFNEPDAQGDVFKPGCFKDRSFPEIPG